uniref:Brain and acute leukemia cytoplasmic protein n=1 Tax=Capra hircus TaxID=9925 RepID=A0A8C2REI3_CAPHI
MGLHSRTKLKRLSMHTRPLGLSGIWEENLVAASPRVKLAFLVLSGGVPALGLQECWHPSVPSSEVAVDSEPRGSCCGLKGFFPAASCASSVGAELLLGGVLEDGVTSNGVPQSTAPSGISNPEKKMSCGTQCPNPQSLSSGPLAQKQNSLRTAEAKRDTKRMSAKEVTINVADSIRQVDRSRRITKNCID